MFNFIKKLLGYPTDAEKEVANAPYKVETSVVEAAPVVEAESVAKVEPQVTDAVTQAPAKKARKPRAPKTENQVKEKAAKPKKPAAMTAKKPGRKPKTQ